MPEEFLGKTYFTGPGEEVELTAPFTGGSGVKIRAFKSTDEGVAFLIETEGKRIYHAGDLNNWVWAGEPEADNKRMSENFHKELETGKGFLSGNGRLYENGGSRCGVPYAFLG